MVSKIGYYNEKYIYDLDSIPNITELINRNICEDKGKKVFFNRTGIVVLFGFIYVIFPCGYKRYDDFYDVQLLLDIFNRLMNEKSMDTEYYDLIELDDEGNGHLLSTAHEIIKDYKENGNIRIENVVQGINIGGKVNWKKTVKIKTQIFTDSGTPIFTDLVMSRKENNKDALLRSFHMYAVNKSIAMFGILFGIDCNYDEKNIILPTDKEYAIKFLKAERHMTYNSRILRVIDLIIRFIDSSENEEKNTLFMSLSTKSFYTVWELMCKIALKDEYSLIKDKIPKPYWQIESGELKYTEQIPDILYREEKELFVVDAKYYNIKKNRPGWHDLVKQYFYAISLKKVLKNVEKTNNVMIIPGEISGIVELWAVSRIENIPMFGEIYGVYFNVNYVMENYCYGQTKNFRKELKIILDRININ